ncbi:MAG: hypothetical protein HUK20_01865 [Fibrobacter sp.]|nr:hypothetical protein [Fibrobacter sp.]
MVNGKNVAHFEMNASVGENAIQWNGEHFERGMYVISIKQGSNYAVKPLLLK